MEKERKEWGWRKREGNKLQGQFGDGQPVRGKCRETGEGGAEDWE